MPTATALAGRGAERRRHPRCAERELSPVTEHQIFSLVVFFKIKNGRSSAAAELLPLHAPSPRQQPGGFARGGAEGKSLGAEGKRRKTARRCAVSSAAESAETTPDVHLYLSSNHTFPVARYAGPPGILAGLLAEGLARRTCLFCWVWVPGLRLAKAALKGHIQPSPTRRQHTPPRVTHKRRPSSTHAAQTFYKKVEVASRSKNLRN